MENVKGRWQRVENTDFQDEKSSWEGQWSEQRGEQKGKGLSLRTLIPDHARTSQKEKHKVHAKKIYCKHLQ